MKNRQAESWVQCSVFQKKVPLELCMEVTLVADGALKPQLVGELLRVMRAKGWSIDDVKRIHRGCK